MPPFRFRLSTLLRLRENLRDECRQQLATAQQAEEIVQARIEELNGELFDLRRQTHSASAAGRINVDRLLDAGRYEMTLRAELHGVKTQLATVSAEVERRRQALVEADREVKTLEKLSEQQKRRHQFEENKREIKQLDAMALQAASAREESL